MVGPGSGGQEHLYMNTVYMADRDNRPQLCRQTVESSTTAFEGKHGVTVKCACCLTHRKVMVGVGEWVICFACVTMRCRFLPDIVHRGCVVSLFWGCVLLLLHVLS